MSVAEHELDEPDICEHGYESPCWHCWQERQIERAEQRYEDELERKNS